MMKKSPEINGQNRAIIVYGREQDLIMIWEIYLFQYARIRLKLTLTPTPIWHCECPKALNIPSLPVGSVRCGFAYI